MSNKSELQARPDHGDQRIEWQRKAVDAICQRSNFALWTILARVKDEHPYSNYPLPEDSGEFEFQIKGALRIELDKSGDDRMWRRLFGTSKKGWPETLRERPKSWRSRVLFKAFDSGKEVAEYLDRSPLLRWEGLSSDPLSVKARGIPGKVVLLQVHDVVLEDQRTFVELLQDFLRNSSQILELVDRREHLCLTPVSESSVQGNPLEPLVVLGFLWDGLSPLHSGYEKNFGEFAKDVVGERLSVNLQTRCSPEQLADAFLASSVKGVFRAASAWLIERIAREAGHGNFITCDYLEKEAEKKEHQKTKPCPVCQVYGGSGCRVKDRSYRQLSPIAFSFEQASDTIYLMSEPVAYAFSHEHIAKKGDQQELEKRKLRIEAMKTPPGLKLQVRIQPADRLSVAMCCLAADLISSGFFRFGRFTSRGFGVVRLVPENFFMGSLDAVLAMGTIPEPPASAATGYDLAKRILTRDPIGLMAEAVRLYIGC